MIDRLVVKIANLVWEISAILQNTSSLMPAPAIGKALEGGNMSKIARNLEFLHKLRDLSLNKIDFATAHLLSHWDLFSGGDEASVHMPRPLLLRSLPPLLCREKY